MERELTYLLYDLCVKWGWCIPPASAEEICKCAQLSAEDFAASVVATEGLDPENEREYVLKIAAQFRERFCDDEISVSAFVDRVRGHTDPGKQMESRVDGMQTLRRARKANSR